MMSRERRTYALFALEKLSEVFGREIIFVRETDEQEVDFGPGGHLEEHVDEIVTVDPSAFVGAFHRVVFLFAVAHENTRREDSTQTPHLI